MKKILIPSPVQIRNQDGSPVQNVDGQHVIISFGDFLTSTILIDAKFGKGMSDILSSVELKSRLGKATPGTEVEIENADYTRLLAVVEEPSIPYNPAVVSQLVSFLLAIKNAK